MTLNSIRNSWLFRPACIVLASSMFFQIGITPDVFALTSGPSQPEVQSFEPVGTTDMVDLFSGDFTYNIPLLELPGPNGGYPFNISYHSGVGMDQEASWVGLGWNLNPGVINRTMRGLPDDFNGEVITKNSNIKKNYTYGVSFGTTFELLGADGSQPAPASLNATLGLRLYYNNYKGVGYNFSPTFGYSPPGNSSMGAFGVNAGFSLDSQDGIGANASVDMKSPGEGKGNPTNSYSLGVGIHSRRGVELSLTGSSSRSFSKDDDSKSYSQSMGGGSTISFSEKAYSPTVSLPMKSSSLDVTSKLGAGLIGTFPSFSIGGFYNEQELKGSILEIKAYGYNNLENAGPKDMMDFNRSKDGMIHENTPNLPIPQLTHDIYSVMGQGIGGMYRPYRSEIGHVHDPLVTSTSSGGTFGLDIGPPDHYGGSFTYSSGLSYSGDWKTGNNWGNVFKFKGNEASSHPDYESVYYKAHGEMTSFPTNELEAIGGEQAVRANLSGGNPDLYRWDNKKNQIVASGSGVVKQKRETKQDESYRMPRNMSVQPMTNEEMGGNSTIVNEYKITLSSGGSVNRSFKNLIGGITSINAEGMRYVYGLPAYNLEQEEFLFSVAPKTGCTTTVDIPANLESGGYKVGETEEFYSKTSIKPYAYAYMLTSILGPDFVDLDNNGPDEGDMGYWVKFNYKRVSDDYDWKAPYGQANYMKGNESSAEDDKASFTRGKKEVYYLESAESSTHKAIFHTSIRLDAAESKDFNNKITNADSDPSDFFYKLDKIELKVKPSGGGTPKLLQTVHFEYDYSLCDDIQNGSQGKLTLKKVYFTYGDSDRGSLSPYVFDYGNTNHSGAREANPNYSTSNYDRWGNYKDPNSGDECERIQFPYSNQFDRDEIQSDSEKQSFKTEMDKFAASWNLTDITLPTGGKITIDYEADDYAYVQHKRPMQMFKITSAEGFGSTNNADWKVYFDLENPITASLSAAEKQSLIKSQYIDGLKVGSNYQLYYKVRMNLRQNYYEYVAGYADLDVSSSSRYGIDTSRTVIDGVYKHTKGFVTLKKMDVNGTIDYHPFRVAAWQHMRTNQPELLFSPGKLADDPGSTDAAKANKIKSLVSFWPTIRAMFKGYRKYAFDKGFANVIDEDYSIIRLTNPDGYKYGGGSRVKRIEINDKWSNSTSETSSSYGQVYEYTIQENGKSISSGVAQYEPMIGGDETPFRYAKNFPGENPVMTDNNLFFEYPVNEAYFPAASVGYRKVRVSSLAADGVINQNDDEDISTTGIVEHEFYTAKDFPVITEETRAIPDPRNLRIPLPLIGQIVSNSLTITQGYSIVLNDMHGKPKSVHYYGLDKYGDVLETANSYVAYEYEKTDKLMSDGTNAYQLKNEVEVINSEYDGSGSADKEMRIVGEEYEFFSDLRHSHNESTVGGLKANTDFVFSALLPLPIIVPWPTVIENTTDLKMIVTNKIIHKAGILKRTTAFDGESTVVTDNLLYDGVTGKPLLTRVNNNYDNPLFKLEYPAHWKYEGMKGAYKNFGLTMSVTIDEVLGNNQYVISPSTISDAEAHRVLEEGDEFLISKVGSVEQSPPKKGTLIEHLEVGTNEYSFVIHTPDAYTLGNALTFKIYRSGRRNQLSTIAGDVLAMANPTENVGEENLPTVNLSNTPDDFVDFMNEYVLQCDGSLLVDELIDFDSREMFDNEGKYKYPQARKLLKTMMFSFCTNTVSGHYCQECQDLDPPVGDGTPNNGDSEGYHISGIVMRDNTVNSQNCECVAYRRERNTLNTVQITDFELGSTFTSHGETVHTMDVNYNGRSTSQFCVFPQGSSTYPGNDNHNICWDPASYTPKVIYYDSVLNASAVEFSDYWDYDYDAEKCPVPAVEPNPYAIGEKGIYRVSKNYYYQDERLFTDANTDLSHDGMYENVDEDGKELRFYPFRWNADLDWPLHTRWVPNQIITQYNEGGFEVENKDILGNYSSAKYGYSQTLPVAVASNTDYFQLYFNSFDDPTEGQKLVNTGTIGLTTNEAHTGKTCAEVTTGGGDKKLKTTIRCAGGATYFISGWVKAEGVDNFTFGGSGAKVDVEVYDPAEYSDSWTNATSLTNSILLVGSVIEGWQRFEGEVTVPVSYNRGRLALVLTAGTSTLYYDDLRVINTEGNAKTYVYHPDTYRLAAVLDENNFASLYSYDEEGKLYLVRKETEEGILTIQESMNHIKE